MKVETKFDRGDWPTLMGHPKLSDQTIIAELKELAELLLHDHKLLEPASQGCSRCVRSAELRRRHGIS